MNPEVPDAPRRPLALLVPMGEDDSKPIQPVLQPIMVLRSQGAPFAVLLVTPHHAYIKAIAGSDLKINDCACLEHELASGDRIALGAAVYQFQGEFTRSVNGHARPEAFLACENPSQRFPLRRPIIMIGTGESSDVRLGNAGAAENAIAVVAELMDGHALVSLGSPPAFQVNGATRVRHRLTEGDIIQAGGYSLRYEIHQIVAPDSSAPHQASAPVEEIPQEALSTVPESTMSTEELPMHSQQIAESNEEESPAAALQPPARPRPKVADSRVPSRNLAAWGPLAQAVISGQTLPEMNLADNGPSESPTGGRGLGILVIILILILFAGGVVLAWLKWGRGGGI